MQAVVSDLATGRAAARAFSLMVIVGGVAPVVAPVAGSLLLQPLGWRGLLGVVLGNATALALAVVPGAAGVASALFGAAQFALAGAVSPLVGIGGGATAAPLATVMVAAAVVALAGRLAAGGRRSPVAGG